MAEISAPDLDLRYGHRSTPRGNMRQRGATGPVVPTPAAGSRMVIVSGATRPAGSMRNQLIYLQHAKGRDGQDAPLFGARGQGLDVARFLAESRRDPHVFHFSVNPDKPSPHLPMAALTQGLMQQVAKDLGKKIDWVGAVHYDTGRVHAHVLLRGRDRDGQDLYLLPDYLKHGIQNRARELYTALKGSEQSREQNQERVIEQTRTQGKERERGMER